MKDFSIPEERRQKEKKSMLLKEKGDLISELAEREKEINYLIMDTLKISNITGYKFIPITDRKSLQEKILKHSNKLSLKGTVLISEKGLNFSIAGGK